MESIFKKYGKILLAVDKFKGSLTSTGAEAAIEEGIFEAAGRDSSAPLPKVVKVPIADGGDGSLEVLSALWGEGCRRVECTLTGPLGKKVKSVYLRQGERAFIEMAAICGLAMVPQPLRNPMNTTTYGLGEAILHAVKGGAKEIFVSIGGSATNDCGVGMVQALGYGFTDKRGEALPTPLFGRDLARIGEILPPAEPLMGLEIKVVCDVTNPLLGSGGATMVYGRQKGADEPTLAALEAAMESFAAMAGGDAEFPGAGAAGGVGFAFNRFLGASLIKGEEFFIELTALESLVAGADLVVGGEGCIDEQSFYGKIVGWLYNLCRKYDKPLLLFCGVDKSGFSAPDCRIFPLSDIENDTSQSISQAYSLLKGRACMAFSSGTLPGMV